MLANQGINAGFLGIGSSGREDSTASALDVFYDASEEPVGDSFTSTNTGYTTTDYNGPGQSTAYGTGQSTTGYSGTGNTARTDTGKQPYINQTGPPVVDTSNDPDDTFGPVNPRKQPAAARGDNREANAPASFGDDEYESEGTGGTPGKKGFRARMKGKLGSKKEHHEEKKRTKAEHELEDKMQQKEIPRTGAVTVSTPLISVWAAVCFLLLSCQPAIAQRTVSCHVKLSARAFHQFTIAQSQQHTCLFLCTAFLL